MSIKRVFLFLIKSSSLGLALFLVAGLSALGTMRVVLSSEEVVVPSVVAKSIPEAGALAARHGLSLRVEGKRNDAKIPADHVAAQEPAAGANLKSHRSIRVWVSLGPRRVTVPALEGGSVRTARLSLDQGQVPLVRVVEVDDPAAEGTVLQQHPPAGEADGAVEGVALLVSRGPVGADYLMPDLIGRQRRRGPRPAADRGPQGLRSPLPLLSGSGPRHRPAPAPARRPPGERALPGQPRHQQGDAMILAPSILSADFGRLAEEVQKAERGGAAVIHVDVMDGHFVPNLTIGPPVVKSLRKATSLPLDCHLMIENADRYVDAFVDAGANWISLHVEAMPHLQRTIAHLRARGVRPGVVLNPATPLGALEEILPEVDYVLVMSVNPGFGGQAFLPASLDKIRRLKRRIDERGLRTQIEVDGGVDAGNVKALRQAGAEIFVAGSAVFGQGDPEAGVRRLLEAGGVTLRSTSRLRVRYAETDQMGVAWHGDYFAWFEVGRTDLLREQGLTYRELEAQQPAPARDRGAGPLPAARPLRRHAGGAHHPARGLGGAGSPSTTPFTARARTSRWPRA